MKLEDLYETPKMIEDLDWHDLNIKEKNHHGYLDFCRKDYERKTKLFDVSEFASVYNYKTEYFCLDRQEQLITYYMKSKVGNNGILKDFVWQSLVWVNKRAHLTYLDKIPSKIFFEYLLPKYHTIITDSEQTWHGRRFWEYRLEEAFMKGLNVYFFNFQNRQLSKLDSSKDIDEYQLEYDIWGPSNIHEMKRLVITDKEL